MSQPRPSPKDIFLRAVEITDAAARERYLREACGDDAHLHKHVAALLQVHAEPDSLLDQERIAAHIVKDRQAASDPTSDQPLERVGTQIGPYKLLQQIGEGGMGVVYMAEQMEPVERRVALKIIKPGMDTRQVIARFEAERQALAMMDHPNIAKVFDAGTTGEGVRGQGTGDRSQANSNLSPDSCLLIPGYGRPYFVMELVRGIPITKYCDEHHLTLKQRLELFLPVCQAVQHAHQKGIIHRDLKPNNVLVAQYDDKPVPKVIDFGVAKAAQKLTERTMFTEFGQVVGTLEYMSPEQARLNQLDIDTRSDIYSLGVLLYELLTGCTPFDGKRLRSAAFDEMLRIIREEEPPKPSTRLSGADTLPSIAANRNLEPARLSRTIRGELDWIVMKALEKDRNRRYETANGFAKDIEHYLNDEPVVACPPSAAYRFRKFARRNKGGLMVAALVLLFLVLLGSVAGWAVRDRAAREALIAQERANREAELKQERAARRAKVAGQVQSIFDEVDQLENEQKWPEALAAARRADAAVAGGEADAETGQRVRSRLKDLEFIERLERIRMAARDPAYRAKDTYPQAFRDYGVDVDELPIEASIERLKARPALALSIAVALDEWIRSRRGSSKGDDAGWKRLVAVAHGIDPDPLRDRLRSTPWQAPPETQEEMRRLADSIDVRAHHPETLHRLAATLQRVQLSDLAIRVLREAQAAYPGDYWLNYELGSALEQKGFNTGQEQHHEAAIRFFTVAVAVRPSADSYLNERIGFLLWRRGDLAQAIAYYRGNGNYGKLGSALKAQGKPDDAIAAYRKAIDAKPDKAGDYWERIADILRDQKKPTEAADAYRQAVAAYQRAIEARPKAAAQYFYDLGRILRAQGKPDDEIAFYREAIAAGSKAAAVYWNYLGSALGAQGKPDEAVAVYRQAIEARPEAAGSYWAAIGRIEQAQGKPDEAVAAFRNAVEKGPGIVVDVIPFDPAGLWRTIGDIRFSQGKSDEAIAAYRQMMDLELASRKAKTGGAGPDLLDDPSYELRRQGKLDEAVAVYRLGIEVVPEHAHAYWHAIGDIRRDQKKLDEAVEAYHKAIGLKPEDAGYRHGLGLALRDQNKPAEANAAFDKAIELYRQAASLTPAARHHAVGSVLRDKGDLDGAIGAFRQALAVAPEYGVAIYDLVAALQTRGRPDEALDVYRKAFQADPAGFRYYSEFADALVRRRKLEEAAALYRKAIEVAPTTSSNFAASSYFRLGNILYDQGKRPEAIVAFSRALELDPKNMTGAYHNIGTALCAMGSMNEAVAWYRRAIESNAPREIPGLHTDIGEVLLQQNNFDEAAAAFRAVVETEKNSPRSHQYLAWILASRPEANLRDPKQAVALARRATELARDSEMAWQYLGWVLYRAGDWKASIEALEKSCKLHPAGTGDYGQWIVMALAHARLAVQEDLPETERERHKAEARRWFEKADQQLGNKWSSRPNTSIIGRAVWDFREEAREFLGTKESKK